VKLRKGNRLEEVFGVFVLMNTKTFDEENYLGEFVKLLNKTIHIYTIIRHTGNEF